MCRTRFHLGPIGLRIHLMRRSGSQEAGEIRIRNLIELVLVFFFAYAVFQIAPAVITRVNYLNELQVIASSPVYETELELRQKALAAAEDALAPLAAHAQLGPSVEHALGVLRAREERGSESSAAHGESTVGARRPWWKFWG